LTFENFCQRNVFTDWHRVFENAERHKVKEERIKENAERYKHLVALFPYYSVINI